MSGAIEQARMRSIPVHVYTLQSFLAGILRTDRPRLTDALNGQSEHLELLDVVSSRYSGGTLRHYGDQAFVFKESVYFVCDRPTDGYRPQHTSIVEGYVRHHVAVSCGPFFIEGRTHLPSEGDLRSRILNGSNRFLPLTAATITSPFLPAMHEQAVVINRERIDYVISSVISIGDIVEQVDTSERRRTIS
ncbi:MAG: hypothetical protein DCC58_19635 [Chloroflexi bacterium]|nr:MAG: hypothetical protein DCC58_19635 [Chloroflexota bacterium]